MSTIPPASGHCSCKKVNGECALLGFHCIHISWKSLGGFYCSSPYFSQDAYLDPSIRNWNFLFSEFFVINVQIFNNINKIKSQDKGFINIDSEAIFVQFVEWIWHFQSNIKVSNSHSIKVSKYVKVLKYHCMKVWKYHTMIVSKYDSMKVSKWKPFR